MKKKVFEMTPEERERAVYIIGNTVLMLEEMYTFEDIAERVDLNQDQVYEILYQIRRRIGKRNFFRSLFIK